MRTTWNLWKWLDAMGIDRPEAPELIPGVQPVVLLGDQSGFTSQILPPMAYMGGERPAIAAVFSGLQLTSRAPGGTYIRVLGLAIAVAGYVKFHITAAPATVANQIAALVKSDMGNAPTQSTLVIGTYAAEPVATETVPMISVPAAAAAGTWLMQDGFYVPPGSTFELWRQTANTAFSGFVMFEDCPALAGRS